MGGSRPHPLTKTGTVLSMSLDVRKIVSVVETTRMEMGRPVEGMRRKVATGVVLTNPFAGRFVDDLAPLVDLGSELGALLVDEALFALGCDAGDVSAYGKAAIVGVDGEIEHAAALIHPRFGGPVRARLGKGPAIIPSTKLLGGPGTRIVAPITNCNDISDTSRCTSPRSTGVVSYAAAFSRRNLHTVFGVVSIPRSNRRKLTMVLEGSPAFDFSTTYD